MKTVEKERLMMYVAIFNRLAPHTTPTGARINSILTLMLIERMPDSFIIADFYKKYNIRRITFYKLIQRLTNDDKLLTTKYVFYATRNRKLVTAFLTPAGKLVRDDLRKKIDSLEV